MNPKSKYLCMYVCISACDCNRTSFLIAGLSFQKILVKLMYGQAPRAGFQIPGCTGVKDVRVPDEWFGREVRDVLCSGCVTEWSNDAAFLCLSFCLCKETLHAHWTGTVSLPSIPASLCCLSSCPSCFPALLLLLHSKPWLFLLSQVFFSSLFIQAILKLLPGLPVHF